mgnify:CR=1 FL=1
MLPFLLILGLFLFFTVVGQAVLAGLKVRFGVLWSWLLSPTLGMGMTERQGGTDVRANITRAAGRGDHVEITGHKWFMSAPMCLLFITSYAPPYAFLVITVIRGTVASLKANNNFAPFVMMAFHS